MVEYDTVTFNRQIKTGVGENDEVYEEVLVDGEKYEVGDLVKTTISRTGTIPCETKASLVAPITQIRKRTRFDSDELLSVSVSFAHLINSVDSVEKVKSTELAALWDDKKVNEEDTVIIRDHTGNDSDCPACSSGGLFAHSSSEKPAYLKRKADEDWF